MIYMRNLFFLLTCFFSVISSAQDVIPLSLEQAVKHAVEFNRELKNADLSRQQTKKQAWEILTIGLPKISGNLDYNYYIIEPFQPAINRAFASGPTPRAFEYLTAQGLATGDSTLYNIFSSSSSSTNKKDNPFILSNNANASITISQLLLDGRYFIGLQARKKLIEVAEQQKKLTEKTLTHDVRKAYYAALIAGESKNVLESNLTVLEKLLDDTRKVFQEGFAEELDVEKLELGVNKLRIQLDKSTRQYENAVDYLKFKIGMDFKQEVSLTDSLSSLRRLMDESVSNSFTPDRRMEYALLKNREILQSYDIKQKFSANFPTLVSFVNIGYTAQSDDLKELFTGKTFDGYNVWNPQGIFGLKLSVPIFDFGGNRAVVQQARLELKKAENDRLNFEQAAQMQVSVAQNNFNHALVEEKNNIRSVQLSEKIFNKARIMFREGLGNSFDLVQAETDYTTSQIELKLSLFNLLMMREELLSATGD